MNRGEFWRVLLPRLAPETRAWAELTQFHLGWTQEGPPHLVLWCGACMAGLWIATTPTDAQRRMEEESYAVTRYRVDHPDCQHLGNLVLAKHSRDARAAVADAVRGGKVAILPPPRDEAEFQAAVDAARREGRWQ